MAALIETWDERIPRDQPAFQKSLEQARGAWVPAAQAKENTMLNFMKPLAEAVRGLVALGDADFGDSCGDIKAHIAGFLEPGLVVTAPAQWLEQWPRYAKGILHRTQRLNGQYVKDQKSMKMLAPCLERLEQAAGHYPNLVGLCPEAMHYRWMLEEFRVSLFAQHLGTRLPVSSKRLDEQWRKVMTWVEDNPR